MKVVRWKSAGNMASIKYDVLWDEAGDDWWRELGEAEAAGLEGCEFTAYLEHP